MNKILQYLALALLFLATSCSDYLEYKDKDKVVPSSMAHYNDLIYTELVKKSADGDLNYLNIMTDDLESVAIPSGNGVVDIDDRKAFVNYYKWAVQTQYTEDGIEKEDLSWANFYTRILMSNIIEDAVNGFSDDREGVKKRLLGEVKFVRALSYFYLINLYAPTYENADQAKTALGVPINKETSISTAKRTRATLQEVINLIEADLKESLILLNQGEKKNSIYRPNPNVVRLLLSRLYLYTKEWKKAADICDELIGTTTATVTTLQNMKTFVAKRGIVTFENPAIIYTWGYYKGVDFATNGNSGTNRARFEVNQELLKLYGANDRRKDGFFKNYMGLTYYPYKFDFYAGTKQCFVNSYRIEEAYYNRAEACIELGEIAKAMEDLSVVRKERIEGGGYMLTATSQVQAREVMREEKRREFCFEGLRWFDIRRWNVEVTHVYHNFADPTKVETYKLKPGSPNYIMPLPFDVARKNDKIEQFTRIETLVY